MGAEDKKNSKNAAPATNFMPEGYSDADFAEVGLLTPMYKPKNAYEGKWPEVLGWVSHVEALPEQKQKNAKGEEEDWVPLALHVILCAPNKGIIGKKTNEKIVERAIGESLLIPLTGSLLYKKEMMIAAFDAQRVWLARILVTGQQPSDYPSDMWVWKAELAKKPRARKDDDRFAMVETALFPEVVSKLPQKVIKALPPAAFALARATSVPIMGQTSSGEVYDRDGVVQNRLVGNASA